MTEKEIRTNQEHARAEARVTTPAGKPDAAPGEPQRSPGGETGKAAGVSEERAERPGPKLVCANPLDPFGQSFHEPVPLSEEEAMLAAARLGFTHFIDIPEGETMVNVLWKKKTAWKLCGIYLIIHRSGAFYIARTTDMKDRLRFHRYQDAFADHQWIAFRPCPQKELRKLEALMIGCAARARLPILNRVAAQHGPYPMDLAYSFDEVFPPWAQERFLAEGELHGETVLEQFAAVYEGAILCERDAWKVFRTERHARGMLEIAHRCILMAIPNPWELENLWWAIQLPTGRGYPMLTLTAGGSKVVLKFTRRPGDPGPVMADLALARNVAGPETESGRRLREELSQYGVVWCDPPDGSADFRIGKDFCAALGWRYPDETARDKDMAREVTRALTAGDFVHLQAPLERAHLVLDHPDVQHAFKLAVMALLRRTAKRARVPHNPIATFSMRNGYCGLPPVPEMNTAAEQPDETASKSEDVKEEETAAA